MSVRACVPKSVKVFYLATLLKLVKMILHLKGTLPNLQQIRLTQSRGCDFLLNAAELLSSAYQRTVPPHTHPWPLHPPRTGDLQRCCWIGRQLRCQHHLWHLSCSPAGCSACDKTRVYSVGWKYSDWVGLAGGRPIREPLCLPTNHTVTTTSPCHSVKAKAGWARL